MRAATDHAAGAFVAELEGQPGTEPARQLSRALDELELFDLPPRVPRSPPEGFVRYGLYPEQYAVAARALHAERSPHAALVLGIRSIGTSLSSVVAATLSRRGVETVTATLRPRGHPFARTARIDEQLALRLCGACGNAMAHALFVVVDEGPGLSGSSFACATSLLRDLGVPDDSIVLMPSFDTDGAAFVSDAARASWARHRIHVAPFDRRWVAALATEGVRDVSAGEWRKVVPSAAEVPVHPQHERRKYLLPAGSERGSDATGLVARFAGLGHHGQRVHDRAERLATAGFGPRVRGFSDGFLLLDWLPSTPLQPGDTGPEVLDRIASYCAFVARTFAGAQPSSPRDLVEMVTTNVREGLEDEHGAALSRFERWARYLPDSTTIVDARMAPHEWLAPDGDALLKVDAYDHGDDDFYPGPVDVAWDLSAAVTEFGLDDSGRDRLVAAFARFAGDPHVSERLPFYEVAYVAFRLGYARLAARTLGGTADGARFCSEELRYRHRLAALLERLPECRA